MEILNGKFTPKFPSDERYTFTIIDYMSVNHSNTKLEKDSLNKEIIF